jgi:hypothetical protein
MADPLASLAFGLPVIMFVVSLVGLLNFLTEE